MSKYMVIRLATSKEIDDTAKLKPNYSTDKNKLLLELSKQDRHDKKSTVVSKLKEIDSSLGYPMKFTKHAVRIVRNDDGDFGIAMASTYNMQSGELVNVEELLTKEEEELIEENFITEQGI